MMLTAVASDIHGSALWCERFLERAEAEGAQRIVLLGDLLYHGPRNPLPDGYDPAEVARMLNAHAESIVACRGNCDAEVDQMLLSFPCMADYALLVEEGRTLFCTHGHVFGPDHLPPLVEGSVVLSGHTHVKTDETSGGIRFVNPGSVSIPKDGSNSFALIEDACTVSFIDL